MTTGYKGIPNTQLPIDGTGEAKPKRSPGRPRADGSPAQSRRSPTGQFSRRDLKTEIAGALMAANIVVLMIPPVSGDALDMTEVDALATAMAEEAKRNARFAKLVDAMLRATGSAGLFGVVGIIAARRMARHGAFGLTRDVDAQLGTLLGISVGKASEAPPSVAEHDRHGAATVGA